MNPTEAGDTKASSLLLEFLPLFHRHFLSAFHERGSQGLTKSQNKALMIIRDKGPITQTELGGCLDMTKGSLTTLIDSLERIGFVLRTRDSNDRRKYWLTLTDGGVGYTIERAKTIETHLANLLERLTPGNRRALQLHLEKIIAILKEL